MSLGWERPWSPHCKRSCTLTPRTTELQMGELWCEPCCPPPILMGLPAGSLGHWEAWCEVPGQIVAAALVLLAVPSAFAVLTGTLRGEVGTCSGRSS